MHHRIQHAAVRARASEAVQQATAVANSCQAASVSVQGIAFCTRRVYTFSRLAIQDLYYIMDILAAWTEANCFRDGPLEAPLVL